MTTDIATVNGVAIDHTAILKSLNLNPTDPKVQALLLVCERYHLDPVMKHLVLIQGSAYVTRDGYLAVAHRSGALDGIEVLEQGETQTHYTAKVAVYRKDMSHPFVFIGRYPKNKQMAKEYGPEMAVKCFDEDTEVLTDQGFQRFSEVTGRVMQVGQLGLEPTDAQPWSVRHAGPMLVHDSQYLNFSVTMNHDMVTTSGRIEAEAMWNSTRRRATWRIPHTVETVRQDAAVSDLALMLAAAYACDGNSGRLKVARPAKVLALTSALGEPRSVHEPAAPFVSKSGREITATMRQYLWKVDASDLGGLISIDTKTWDTARLLELSQRQARLLVESLIDFDGNRTAVGVRRYYSSRPDHLGAMELAALTAGMTVARRRPRQSDIGGTNWSLTISERKASPVTREGRDYHLTTPPRRERRRDGLHLEDHDGPVWCVTVPSSTIIVRRNGYAMVCGNCAEVQALRRAFNVTGISAADEMWAEEPSQVAGAVPAAAPVEAGSERRDQAVGAAPSAPPTRRRPPPLADPDTGEVIPAKSVEHAPFTEANERYVNVETAYALKEQALANGITAPQIAKLVQEHAPLSDTNIMKRVLKEEWPAVEAAVENYFAKAVPA